MPPPAYGGDYLLHIAGGNAVELTSFAGCFEKVAGLEYEDCHFTTPRFTDQLRDWFTDATLGSNVYRSLTIYRRDLQTGVVVQKMVITDAFIREFSTSALDGISNSLSTVSLVVVPALVTTAAASSAPLIATAPPATSSANFQIEIDNIDASRVAALSGLRMSWQKLEPQVVTRVRRQFVPGAASVDNIELRASPLGTTVSDLTSWMNDVANGIVVPRAGRIDYLANNLTTVVRSINLAGLVPLQFPAFPIGSSTTHRTMTLRLASFSLP